MNLFILLIGDESFLLQIRSIKITPDILTPGAELTLEAEGTLLETVDLGSFADVQVKLGVVTLIRKKFDLCETLEDNKDKIDLQCPIERGDLKVSTRRNTIYLLCINIYHLDYSKDHFA